MGYENMDPLRLELLHELARLMNLGLWWSDAVEIVCIRDRNHGHGEYTEVDKYERHLNEDSLEELSVLVTELVSAPQPPDYDRARTLRCPEIRLYKNKKMVRTVMV